MKYQELIERYIYAATRYMKKSEKEDVAKELRSIIDDMLEERCGEGEPDEATVKEILSELGNPGDLYEKYSSDGKECLIGAPYYGMYKRMLKMVLCSLVVGLVIAQVIVTTMNSMPIVNINDVTTLCIALISDTISTLFEGLFFGFAAVTLWFAIMYHKGIKMDNLFDSLENLPQLPRKETTISRTGVAFEIGLSVVFITLFLMCPQILSAYDMEREIFVPILSSEYIQSTWYLVALFAAFGIGRDCIKLIEGTYTRRLLIVTLIADVVSAVLAIIWLWDTRIVNANFTMVLEDLLAGTSPLVYNLMSGFNYFFLGCILLALAEDLVVVIWKYNKCKLLISGSDK